MLVAQSSCRSIGDKYRNQELQELQELQNETGSRIALPRNPAWYVHQREQMAYACTHVSGQEKPKASFKTCHLGSRGSAPLPLHSELLTSS
jgi:hypothetical protein